MDVFLRGIWILEIGCQKCESRKENVFVMYYDIDKNLFYFMSILAIRLMHLLNRTQLAKVDLSQGLRDSEKFVVPR